MPATIRWIALALLGLLVAGGVSIAASSLASQQIGLASEPISAGDALAPVVRTHAKSHRRQPPTRHTKRGPRTTAAPSAPYPPSVSTAPPSTSTAPMPTTSRSPPSTSTPVSPPPGRRPGGDGSDSRGDRGGERGESGHGADD
jgi:hypothetical protein